MKTGLSKYYHSLFGEKKLYADDLYLKQLKNKSDVLENIVINRVYQNYKDKEKYPVSLGLLFTKSDSYDEDVMNKIQFTFRNQILQHGDMIFNCKIDRVKHLEYIFYISEDAMICMKTFSQLKSDNSFDDVKLIFCYDQEWKKAEKYTK